MELATYETIVQDLADVQNWEGVKVMQYQFMTEVWEGFKKVADEEPTIVNKVVRDLVEQAIKESTNGNCTQYIMQYNPTEAEQETAIKAIQDGAIWEILGDYLLDCQDYEDRGDYAIDVVFGGLFVPEWDGWEDA